MWIDHERYNDSVNLESALFEDLMQRHIEFHWLYERNATAENLTNAKKSTQDQIYIISSLFAP